ncbi:hypothetical protein [uncultured Gordonia sp.]|uniref:hypothetical protein n=1 Tax=uncultured Gordonia sp. TaxID=198437 RepID=UPI002593AE90|nr:hypothetical protein [uncultured Gordonia sp.]
MTPTPRTRRQKLRDCVPVVLAVLVAVLLAAVMAILASEYLPDVPSPPFAVFGCVGCGPL